jgi:hypothetical protein
VGFIESAAECLAMPQMWRSDSVTAGRDPAGAVSLIIAEYLACGLAVATPVFSPRCGERYSLMTTPEKMSRFNDLLFWMRIMALTPPSYTYIVLPFVALEQTATEGLNYAARCMDAGCGHPLHPGGAGLLSGPSMPAHAAAMLSARLRHMCTLLVPFGADSISAARTNSSGTKASKANSSIVADTSMIMSEPFLASFNGAPL